MTTRLPARESGFLYIDNDDNETHVYKVETADYNFYETEGYPLLTLYCRAGSKVLPPETENPHPWIEINLPLPGFSNRILEEGQKFDGVAYDDEFGGNLTNIYYFSHGGFEDFEVVLDKVHGTSITARITGEGHGCPVELLAEFTYNPDRKRSFS